jgi:Fe(3+) dicitrate transport protein
MEHEAFGRSILLAAVSLASTAALGAATEAQEALTPIDNVTIIGRQMDVADVPGSAHVIDVEELEIFNDTDVLRVLRTVPGVYLQEEEGFGLRPNIGIRGSGLDRSARIALLEDGVLIAPAPYAAPSAYYFPTQRRMAGLEVLKGPASVAVGPRTTGGALNLTSTPIPDDLGANLDLRGGDHGTIDLHANTGNHGERLSWLLETVQSQSDGFKHIDGPVGGDTGFEIEDYVAKIQLDSDPTAPTYHSLRVKLGYTDQRSDETYLGLTEADFAVDPMLRYAASAGDVFNSEHEQWQASYLVDPGKRWRGEVTAYRNDFKRNWYKLQSVNGAGMGTVLDDPETYATELAWLQGATSPDDAIFKRANNRSYYSQGLQASIDWDLNLGDAEVLLTTGLRIHEDEEDRFQHENGYRMEDGALIMTTAGPGGSKTNRVSDARAQSYFVNAEIRVGDWILTPGLRFEDVDLRRFDYSTADPSRDQGPTRVRKNSVSMLIPGMGALYRVSDEWRLLAGIHKGFNPPGPGSSAEEESSLNIEVGTRYDADSLSFEAIYFVNDYDNLVGTVTESTGGGGDIGDQFDAGEVRVAGIELSTGYSLSVGGFDVPLGLRYTWTREFEFRNSFESGFDPWGEVEAGDQLPYIPEHQLRATAGLEAARWRINLAASYLGELRTKAGQGRADPAESIESRVVWDLMANWQLTERLASYVKVENLWDETYVASRRPAGLRPGLPRTAYIGLTYRL